MTTNAHHDVDAEVRKYLSVFAALLVLTVVTVGASYVHLPPTPTVIVAVAIALLKAALVGMFFMHLKGERPMIHWSLALTAVLFIVLIAFILWTEGDHLFGTRYTGAFEEGPAQ